MKKKVLTLFIVTILSISVVACGKKSSTTSKIDNNKKQEQQQKGKEDEKQKQKKEKLDGLKEEYKKTGFTVGENEELAFVMVGANNGYKFKLDDELIEIYEYDMDNLTEDGKKYVEQAKKGSISMSGFNIPVKFKDGLMIARYNKHSKKDKIIEIFNNYN